MNTPKQITLANLPESTEQEVFDHVGYQLLMQNETSMLSGTCAYRGSDDLKCAAGHCMTDEEYEKLDAAHSIEGNIWADLCELGVVPNAHARLINDLQGMHDQTPAGYWPNSLRNLAERKNLSTTVIDNFKRA